MAFQLPLHTLVQTEDDAFAYHYQQNSSLMQGSQPIITADLSCLECELGVSLVACMHSHKQHAGLDMI